MFLVKIIINFSAVIITNHIHLILINHNQTHPQAYFSTYFACEMLHGHILLKSIISNSTCKMSRLASFPTQDTKKSKKSTVEIFKKNFGRTSRKFEKF